jgi:quercetin dioxygenase-like cupin family protein
MSVQISQLEMLDAVQNFTLATVDPQFDKFREAMRNWGDDWIELAPVYLPAADFLTGAGANASPGTRALLELFERHKYSLRWEQSYQKQDGLVPDAMLDGYAFAELIGTLGPFVSNHIRVGVAIWGPDIVYPRHHHQAEEIYLLLAGSAEFRVGDQAETTRVAGDVVYVESNSRHGFRISGQALVVIYLWRAGDLRQTSNFD